jgi:hypothetical protein
MLGTAAKKQRLQQALGGGCEGEGGVLLKKTNKPAVRKLLHNPPQALALPGSALLGLELHRRSNPNLGSAAEGCGKAGTWPQAHEVAQKPLRHLPRT